MERHARLAFCLARSLEQSAAEQFLALGIPGWPGLVLAGLIADLLFGEWRLDQSKTCIIFIFPQMMFPVLLVSLCFISNSWCENISAGSFVEATKKAPVKTRLVNQFLLSIYIKNGGMLPDKSLSTISLTTISCGLPAWPKVCQRRSTSKDASREADSCDGSSWSPAIRR